MTHIHSYNYIFMYIYILMGETLSVFVAFVCRKPRGKGKVESSWLAHLPLHIDFYTWALHICSYSSPGIYRLLYIGGQISAFDFDVLDFANGQLRATVNFSVWPLYEDAQVVVSSTLASNSTIQNISG